jgi:hypothetical protein
LILVWAVYLLKPSLKLILRYYSVSFQLK